MQKHELPQRVTVFLDLLDQDTVDELIQGLSPDRGRVIRQQLSQLHDRPPTDEEVDEVVGLEVGADDYISKPFHIREVQARIRSVLRRSAVAANSLPDNRAGSGGSLIFEGWSACPDTFELRSPKGDIVNLTTTDFRLLQMFLEAPKRVLSRDHIMTALNGHDWQPYDRTIDNQVARLRKKIERDPSHPEMIKTVRGVGYLFAKDVVHA